MLRRPFALLVAVHGAVAAANLLAVAPAHAVVIVVEGLDPHRGGLNATDTTDEASESSPSDNWCDRWQDNPESIEGAATLVDPATGAAPTTCHEAALLLFVQWLFSGAHDNETMPGAQPPWADSQGPVVPMGLDAEPSAGAAPGETAIAATDDGAASAEEKPSGGCQGLPVPSVAALATLLLLRRRRR